jgi:hypothetical protein
MKVSHTVEKTEEIVGIYYDAWERIDIKEQDGGHKKRESFNQKCAFKTGAKKEFLAETQGWEPTSIKRSSDQRNRTAHGYRRLDSRLIWTFAGGIVLFVGGTSRVKLFDECHLTRFDQMSQPGRISWNTRPFRQTQKSHPAADFGTDLGFIRIFSWLLPVIYTNRPYMHVCSKLHEPGPPRLYRQCTFSNGASRVRVSARAKPAKAPDNCSHFSPWQHLKICVSNSLRSMFL